MKRLILCSVLILSCISVTSAAEPLKLSLAEAIRMAAERNLDVRAELYTPAQFEAEINRNKAIYDPSLNLQVKYSDTTAPIPRAIVNGQSSGSNFQLNSSLSQLFWTGATTSLEFNNTYNNSNSFSTLRDYWQSSLGVTLSQPLLKNFGRENTEININVSRLSKFASLEHFNTRLINTIAQVRVEYFKLYSLREQLEVRKVSLELAGKILTETKARVAAGVLPAMEILNAEFGLTSREKDLIDTERAVNDEVDALRLLLQIEGKDDVVTINLPRRELFSVNEEEAVKRALMRFDIKELKRNLDISELQTRVFGNNIKPDLSLIVSGALVGLDQSYPRNLEKLSSFDYPAWNIGLNFSYPFGNNAAENDYRKSRLKSAQIALQVRSLEEGAINSVKSATRAINSGFKQIDVTDRGRTYAEERLKAFIRKNEVGLATTKDVLDVENDLATAKNNQIIALVNYDNAVTQFWQVTGELLEREGIHVVEGDADKLYTNTR